MFDFDLSDFSRFEFEDSNGDGIIDSYNGDLDTTGDGIANAYVEAVDTNGDGVEDTAIMLIDTDGDGIVDSKVEAYDTNHSGMPDSFVVYHDTTGDGNPDTVAKMFDYDQDGEVDSVNMHKDMDGDGQYEYLSKSYDASGDGTMDTIDVYFDFDGSGHADLHQMYSFDPTLGVLIPNVADGFDIGYTNLLEHENFDPSAANPFAVTGNPAASMEYWEFQGDTGRCALYSEKFVIEELTGQDIDIEDFAEVAKANGWFTEEGGTTFLNMNNMLDYYGIENQMSFHNSITDIENCLNNGGKVIVSIDSDEIWYGTSNNIFSPDSAADHAVEVIGIDRTDPNHPMVILNDSGTPDGRGEMVPLEVFEGAWEDGDCQMIECYKASY